MSTEERSVNQPEEQPSLSEQRLIRRAKIGPSLHPRLRTHRPVADEVAVPDA